MKNVYGIRILYEKSWRRTNKYTHTQRNNTLNVGITMMYRNERDQKQVEFVNILKFMQ